MEAHAAPQLVHSGRAMTATTTSYLILLQALPRSMHCYEFVPVHRD